MPKTIEEINLIINKIDVNLPKGLNGDDAEKILEEIKSDLGIVKKNSEEKYKEIVDKKTDEIKKGINASLSGELNLTRTQDALKAVKTSLEELKNEINKIDSSLVVPEINQQQTSRPTTPSFLEFGDKITKNMIEMHEAGTEMGSKALPIIGTGIGAASSAAFSGIYGLTMAGTHLTEQAMNQGGTILENAGGGLKDFTENMAGKGADVYENTRQGFENVTTKAMDNSAEVAKSFLNIFDSKEPLNVRIEMLEKNGKAALEAKDSVIDLLKKQLASRDQEIIAKQKQIDFLLQQQSQSASGVMQIAQTLAGNKI